MCTSLANAHRAGTEDPASVVLAAEQAALADIESFKRQTLRLVAVSCLRAVLVQKRTQARIGRLRERVRAEARLRCDRVGREIEALEADVDVAPCDPAALDQAISRVVTELFAIPGSG